MISVDLDPSCQPVAELLNRRHLKAGRFLALTSDMRELVYPDPRLAGTRVDSGAESGPDLVINTSCEHLEDFAGWYRRIPGGTLLALQSNDNFDCEEHTNCVADLGELRTQAPLVEELFAGDLPLKRYRRFMLIGRK